MMDTLARYFTYADLGEAEEFIDTFTPDGVLEVIMPGTTEVAARGFHQALGGHDEMRTMNRNSAAEPADESSST